MPWKIQKRNDQFCVVKQGSDGGTVKCHPSRERALAHMRALYANTPKEASSPKKPYGNVRYADPGYQKDGKKRYPIDTPEHIRAAWSYINQKANGAKYSSDQLRRIKARIKAAASKAGIKIAGESVDILDIVENLSASMSDYYDKYVA